MKNYRAFASNNRSSRVRLRNSGTNAALALALVTGASALLGRPAVLQAYPAHAHRLTAAAVVAPAHLSTTRGDAVVSRQGLPVAPPQEPEPSDGAPYSPPKTGFVWTRGNVRLGPSTDEPVVATVNAEDIVELIDRDGDWWQVRIDTASGWINASLILANDLASAPGPAHNRAALPITVAAASENSAPPPVEPTAAEAAPEPTPMPVEPTPAPVEPDPAPVEPTPVPAAPLPAVVANTGFQGIVANDGEVRAGPGSRFPQTGAVEAGSTVQLLDTTGAWWRIQSGALSGWVSRSMLKVPLEAIHHWPAAGLAITMSVVPAPPVAPLMAAAPSGGPARIELGALVKLPNTAAPHPYLAPDVAAAYMRARSRVAQAAGVDYLGTLGEALRPIDYETSKPGVIRHSWHKAGRAIDIAQSFTVSGRQGVIFARDAAAPPLYRVLVRCAAQDGSMGGYYQFAGGYYVDVTTILLSEGFTRIPPNGSVSEAWHYEMSSGLTWAAAMSQIYDLPLLRRLYPEVWR